ncbi:hypothetical protein BJV78DRAFT_1153988 [Lactifluus subvellereus]|nr:hypothetical protein BJV78DRAFT_1153988 [Lactifluus subvellereus]
MTFPNDCVMSVLGLCTRWLSGTGTRPPMFSPDRDVWTSGRMEEDEESARLQKRGASWTNPTWFELTGVPLWSPTSKPGAAPALTAAAAAQLQVQVPFILHSTLSITDHGGAFELTFIPRANALDDFAVELYLGAGASSATCSQVTGGSEWTPPEGAYTLIEFISPLDALAGLQWRGFLPGPLRMHNASEGHMGPACAALQRPLDEDDIIDLCE